MYHSVYKTSKLFWSAININFYYLSGEKNVNMCILKKMFYFSYIYKIGVVGMAGFCYIFFSENIDICL